MKENFTSNQRHHFEEERARTILALYDPARFQNSVLSESPDIINECSNIGVEVTDSMREDLQKKLSWARSITGKTANSLSKTDKEHIRSHEVSARELPNGIIFAGTACWGEIYSVQNAFQKKLKKLNEDHFRKFRINALFIYGWLMDDDELEMATSFFLKEVDNHSTLLFDIVYIFCERSNSEGQLVEINIKEKSYVTFDISSEQMNVISHSSFEKVIGKSHEEFYGTK